MSSPDGGAGKSRGTRAATLAAGIAVAAYAATLLWCSTPGVAMLVLAMQAALALPGVLVVRSAAGRDAGWLPALTFGPMIGTSISSLALLWIWSARLPGTSKRPSASCRGRCATGG